MSEKKKYDTTVARIAGNVVPGLIASGFHPGSAELIQQAVIIARSIVRQVERTEPPPEAA